MRPTLELEIARDTIAAILIGFAIAICSWGVAIAQTSPFLVSPHYGSAIINQGYSSGHKAYDFNLVYQPVLSAAQGTVAQAKWYNDTCHRYNGIDTSQGNSCGYGLYIRIDHSNGYSTYYAHLSSTAFAYTEVGGVTAKASQVIATSGATGWTYSSANPGAAAPHLHFEVRKDYQTAYVDPSSPNLWSDGQWATPSRPIPAPVSGGEILVDDTENTSSSFDKGAGANFTGVCDGNCNGWASISGGLGNRMFDTTADGGAQVTQWARWKPSISADGGIYEVYVHVPDTSGASWQAPYVIKHFSGTSAGMVDQEELNNRQYRY